MEYKIIRTNRKTLALEINSECEVLVRSPLKCSENVISAFVSKHEDWIERNLKKCEERRKNAENYKIDESEKEKYIKLAKSYLPARTAYWSSVTGLVPTAVKITSASKRYGSCSGKNSICYSYRVMAYPEKAIDYVIVHELAHIKHKNHGAQFYKLIEKYIPDYIEYEKILKHKGEN